MARSRPYLHDQADPHSLSANSVSCLFRTRKKGESILWVGTRTGGLNKFYPETGKFIRFRSNPEDTISLSSDYISSVYEDKSGTLWVGTTLGFHRYNSKDNNFTQIVDKEKKLYAEILSIQEDEKGFIWLNSTSGLHMLDPKSYDLQTHGGRFARWAYDQSPNGELLYGLGKFFRSFHPNHLKPKSYIPSVVLTDFQIFNKSVQVGPAEVSPLQRSITETSEIVLSHDQSMISFEFAALDYSKPSRNKYV